MQDISAIHSFAFKNTLQGLSWWSSGYDTVLPVQGERVRSLVGELRSHMPQDTAKINKLINLKK